MHAFGQMKTLRYGAAALCGMGLATAIGGCDPQASPEFLGESLFTIRGRVTITEDYTEGKLEPALAFIQRQSGEIQVVDVAVKGEFPSNFRFDVFDRPTDDVLGKLTDLELGPIAAAPGSEEDEPLAAIGYITAVTSDHPDTFYFASESSSEVRPSSCSGGPCPCDPVRGCATTEEWCAGASGDNCYRETTVCPEPDSPPSDCHVEREGNPALKEPTLSHFAGLSQNYLVVYLKDAAPAGSFTAAWLGSPAGLRAGYHLLETLRFDEAEQVELSACHDVAEERAFERYNAAHDTEYGHDDLDLISCETGCVEVSEFCQFARSTVCDLPAGERQGVIDSLERAIIQSKLDMACVLSPLAPVKNIANTSISIVISPDVQPGF